MRCVIQRVSEAVVRVEGHEVSKIGPGLLVFLGIEERDREEDVAWLVGKIASMRLFPDDSGKMNVSLKETAGDALIVSQFTLHASTRKGNRPSFIKAAASNLAEPLYEKFLKLMSDALGKPVGAGVFGADMKISLVNDGPVTVLMDSHARE